MKELELIDQFTSYLDSLKIEYKTELRKGWRSGSVDIVVKNNGYLHSIEAKLNNVKQVIQQATKNLLYFKTSYILVPVISKKNLEKAKSFGLGVFIYENETFLHPIKPKINMSFLYSHKYPNYYFKSLINWVFDRAGRKFTKSEIPENYSSKKIRKLRTFNIPWITNCDIKNIDWKKWDFKFNPLVLKERKKYKKELYFQKSCLDRFMR